MPDRRLAACLVAVVLTVSAACPAVAADRPMFSAEDIEFFEKEIRPIFVEHCQECHGPEEPEAGLRLDARATILKGGDTGPAIVPGKPDESELILAVQYDPAGYQMPPDGACRMNRLRSSSSGSAGELPGQTRILKLQVVQRSTSMPVPSTGLSSRWPTSNLPPSVTKRGAATRSTASSSPGWKSRG